MLLGMHIGEMRMDIGPPIPIPTSQTLPHPSPFPHLGKMGMGEFWGEVPPSPSPFPHFSRFSPFLPISPFPYFPVSPLSWKLQITLKKKKHSITNVKENTLQNNVIYIYIYITK